REKTIYRLKLSLRSWAGSLHHFDIKKCDHSCHLGKTPQAAGIAYLSLISVSCSNGANNRNVLKRKTMKKIGGGKNRRVEQGRRWRRKGGHTVNHFFKRLS
ncbi:hypothetical protein ATANTOWER_018637, partial [Ataeniobius toweri]|nr:hypothetical protein [Ataeniobius toweri]